MKKALYYTRLDSDRVRCELCPHYCIIHNNANGFCQARRNQQGELYGSLFGKITAIALDPIEKKPLYHFFPGAKILSVGSLGCNLRCIFCQNFTISQPPPEAFHQIETLSVESLVEMALKQPLNIGIAFTYNEPGISYEYMTEVASLAKKNGLKTVMVSNGYINQEPLNALIPLIDAFNIDLKAFTEHFYKSITQSSLAPVKRTIQQIAQSQKHLEITNLIIPGLNDQSLLFEEMVRWIATETGDKTVLHLSRYFPAFEMNRPETPIETMLKLYEIAQRHLKYVYLGNVNAPSKSTTFCDQCHHPLITRHGRETTITGLDKDGNCLFCGNHVINDVL